MDDREAVEAARAAPTQSAGFGRASVDSPDVRGGLDEVLARGTVVDRFVVLRLLGAGGTGAVYAAHDPDLDRTIALKVLRRELVDRADARARFLREAQALARLSHPNVISVYDVGAADGCTFIAMEYIDGRTFADWVDETRPSWTEIVGVLVKAARGLVAAHAAGLIHRDFKPANLLVGSDGRVLVTDFGLARAAAEDDSGDPMARPRTGAFAESITMSGATQGTPAYMAPEQRRGEAADARADQFSFCVTLYEALFRVHPLVQPALEDSRGVPVWLQRTIQRGLAARPEDRFPSMERLLGALTGEPRRRSRRIRAAVASASAILVSGSLALAFSAVNERGDVSCTGGREQVARIWNEAAVDRLRSAFSRTGRPHARSSAARVAARLDEHAAAWAHMHRSACLATERGEQSADLLDRRMICLGRRLSQMNTLVDLFVRADGGMVDDAHRMLAGLDSLQTCADAEVLLSGAQPPSDPTRRARMAELERQADRAELERLAGRPQAAAAAARKVLESAEGQPPLAALAGRVLGRSLEDLGRPAEAREALVSARRLAERASDPHLAAELMLDLLIVVGLREQRRGEAALLAQLTEAALERPDLAADPALRARLLAALGSLAHDEGKSERSIELQGQVLALQRGRLPAVSEEVAVAEYNLANALASGARYEEARAHYRESLAIRRRLLGDDHPRTADVHTSLGVDAYEQGKRDEAREHYLAALAVLRRVPEYRNYPLLLNNLGALELDAGNHEAARQYLEEALEVRERLLGAEHLDVAVSLHNLGDVPHLMGDFEAALAIHRRANEIWEKTAGKDHPYYARGLTAIGEDLRRLGRAEEALRYQDRALEILRARMADHPLLDQVQVYRSLALIDLGRRREAIPVLERALTTIPAAQKERGWAAFGLARALEPRRPRSPRTVALARQALASFTALHARTEREQVAAYLARSTAR